MSEKVENNDFRYWIVLGVVIGIMITLIAGFATNSFITAEDFKLLQEAKQSGGYLEDKELFWTEYNLGKDPFISCDELYSTAYGVWLCKTDSVAGFEFASLDIRPIFSDLNTTALNCLGIETKKEVQ